MSTSGVAHTALATHNIRANAVAPGVIDTSMTAKTLAHQTTRSARLARFPLTRFGTPLDVAEAACFLLTDAADWLTGTTVTVDDGQSIGVGAT
jgi:NAD(P)-dependent dehydrogenase (short-subunit alcohol dehydrogenase family)